MTAKHKYHSNGHLPWQRGHHFVVDGIEFTDSPYDVSQCKSIEKRELLFSRVNNRKHGRGDCYACNQGHLIFNIILPLFSYLFFVREKHPVNVRGRNATMTSFPLENTLLLYSGDTPKKPSYLFDFVTSRFAQYYESANTYFASKKDGASHCFSKVSIHLFQRGANWDPGFIQELEGRWGTGGIHGGEYYDVSKSHKLKSFIVSSLISLYIQLIFL